jgi:hypothetical protein
MGMRLSTGKKAFFGVAESSVTSQLELKPGGKLNWYLNNCARTSRQAHSNLRILRVVFYCAYFKRYLEKMIGHLHKKKDALALDEDAARNR